MVTLICTLLVTVIKHLMAQMRQRGRDQDKICPLGTSLMPYYLQQSPSSVAYSVGRVEPSWSSNLVISVIDPTRLRTKPSI